MNSEDPEKPRPTHEVFDELSATELNDIITSSPIFLCKKCNQFLVPPIKLVSGTGNVCGKCTDETTGIHNSALEIVLQNLAIPCPYAAKGCKEKLEYFNVATHSLTCAMRNYYCPFLFLNECNWQGSSSGLLNHSRAIHSEYVLRTTGDSFLLDIDISSSNDLFRLLSNDTDSFILHAKCDLETSHLYYVLYYIGTSDKAANFSYSVEQTGCVGLNSCSLQHGSNSVILHDMKFSIELDKANALSIDLSLVKQLVQDPIIATLIKITSKNAKTEELDERVLNFFECPVCNNYMKPPIFQCLSGHSLCNRCRPKLGQCPTCRTGFGNTRNYALEALSNGIKFPCVFRDLGCRVVLTVSEISKHETECTVKPYHCPFLEVSRCAWEGTYSNIVTHLKAQHADKSKFSNYNKVCAGFSYESNFSDLYCMITNGEIFRVCHKRDMGNQNTYWAVQYVGPRGEAKNYKCEVGMVDTRNENRKLIRIDLCQDLTTYDNMFNQCILLPSNVVSWFSCNGQVTYYCKITRINNIP